MSSETRSDSPANLGIGFPGRVGIASSMSGGLLIGGFLVTLPSLFDPFTITAVPYVTQILFCVGAALGLVHGSVIGYLGRPTGMDARAARSSVINGVIVALPGMVFSYWLTLWITMTKWSLVKGVPLLVAGSAAAWLAGFLICVWGLVEVVRAARTALVRWQDRRLGLWLVATTFVALAIVLAWTKPEIWWTDARISNAGAVILALGLTLWAALPIEVLLLHMRGRSAST